MALAVMLAVLLAQATPAPSPTSTGECFRDATVSKSVQPSIEGLDGDFLDHKLTTDIKVLVGADGSIKGTSILNSSGYRGFDLAAQRAARASTYLPKLVNCKPVDGEYTFRANLTPMPLGPP
jgi:TonB family protein